MKNFIRLMVLPTIGIGIFMSSCNKNEISTAVVKPATSIVDGQAMVMTPGGLMPASNVHYVAPGQVLSFSETKATITDAKSRKIVAEYPISQVAVQVRKSGIGGSGKIASANTTSNIAVANTAETASSLIMGSGYLAQYTIPAGNTIQSFSSDFTVPSNINDSGSAKFDFLWNAIWASDGKVFEQPVIYYDKGGAGSGWYLWNWVYWNGAYYYGKAIPVRPGTPVTGKMSLVATPGDTSYSYKCEFLGYDSATITYTYSRAANIVQQCWETYSNPSYVWFPHDTWQKVTNMQLYYVGSSVNQPINWSVVQGNNAVATPNGVNTTFTNNNSSNSIVNFYMGYDGPIAAGHNYKITTAVNNTSVLDVTGGSTANGTPVEIWTNNSPTSPNQVWSVTSTDNGYTYVLRPLSDTTKALTVAGGGTSNGTAITISTYTGASSQIWRIFYNNNGKYSLIPQNALYASLDVTGGSSTAGTKLELYQSNGALAQQYNFVLQ